MVGGIFCHFLKRSVIKCRKWVFYDNPVTVDDEDIKSNIFELPDGRYLITLADFSRAYNASKSKTFKVKVALPTAVLKRGIRVSVRNVEDDDWRGVKDISVDDNGRYVIITFKSLISAGGILIERKK